MLLTRENSDTKCSDVISFDRTWTDPSALHIFISDPSSSITFDSFEEMTFLPADLSNGNSFEIKEVKTSLGSWSE